MTVFDSHPTNPINGHPAPADEDLLVKLRRWADTADHRADELATRGGQEREAAVERMKAAERYDEQAVVARAKADELRAVIGIVGERRRLAEAGLLADHGPLDGAS